jgi:hypothetical protein
VAFGIGGVEKRNTLFIQPSKARPALRPHPLASKGMLRVCVCVCVCVCVHSLAFQGLLLFEDSIWLLKFRESLQG